MKTSVITFSARIRILSKEQFDKVAEDIKKRNGYNRALHYAQKPWTVATGVKQQSFGWTDDAHDCSISLMLKSHPKQKKAGITANLKRLGSLFHLDPAIFDKPGQQQTEPFKTEAGKFPKPSTHAFLFSSMTGLPKSGQLTIALRKLMAFKSFSEITGKREAMETCVAFDGDSNTIYWSSAHHRNDFPWTLDRLIELHRVVSISKGNCLELPDNRLLFGPFRAENGKVQIYSPLLISQQDNFSFWNNYDHRKIFSNN